MQSTYVKNFKALCGFYTSYGLALHVHAHAYVITVSLSTVVLNSRDTQGCVGVCLFCASKNYLEMFLG